MHACVDVLGTYNDMYIYILYIYRVQYMYNAYYISIYIYTSCTSLQMIVMCAIAALGCASPCEPSSSPVATG